LNMSAAPQKLSLDASSFAAAKPLLMTDGSKARGKELSLAAYGVFIGELTK